MSNSLKIEGLDDLLNNVGKAKNQMRDLLTQAMEKSTTLVQNTAKEIRPDRFKQQTGNLRRSIYKSVEGPERGIVYVDAGAAPYGAGVEYGTQPHTIYPKRGKWLAFTGSSGQTVFMKKIDHPGSRPYPYLEPSLDEKTDDIVKVYEDLAAFVANTLTT